MSVPLDRLYNFLHDISDRALLIYRWTPHGSKKLDDLGELMEMPYPGWRDRTKPVMICHDQEPLLYELYSESELRSLITLKDQIDSEAEGTHDWNQAQIDFLSTLHLRGLIYYATLGTYDKILILHSEKRSKQLQTYENNGYVGVYYWSHAVIAADWFRYASVDPRLIINFDQIQHDFLIYNRAWAGTREYRLTFMHELVQQQLQSHCLTSFAKSDNGQYYSDYRFDNPTLSVDLQGLAQHFPTNTHDSNASADYNQDDYSSIGIEVVLETLFDDSRLHLTEKTLRPIACGRPFILMATHGSLQYLKDYGFRTFDGLINETYDTIQDPRVRLQAVIVEMSRIAALSKHEKYSLWKQLYEIAKFNQQLFFSPKWQQSIHQEFLTNLSRSMSILDQYKNRVILDRICQLWNDALEFKDL
jgi:hypothetical protein